MPSTLTSSQQPHSRKSFIALCLGFFMVMIDVTVVNVALPSMKLDLNSSMEGLQWVIDGYTLTLACLLLSAGRLADKTNAKNVFLSGLFLFVFTSMGCGIAPNVWFLIFFRLLQGMAAALVVPTSLALISASYESRSQQAKAIGMLGATGGIAAAFGPVLGGVVTAWFGWRAVFFLNIPIGIFALLLTARYVQKPVSRAKGHFDLAGQITGIISIAALAFSLIEAGKTGWLSPLVLTGFCIFFVTFIAFIVIESYIRFPMFPLKFFKFRSFSVALAVGMIMNIGFFGQLFFLPLYFQQYRKYSVLMTGLALLPETLFGALSSYWSGRIVAATNPKLPMVLGLAVGSLGFFTMLIADQYTPSYFLLVWPLMAIGFGITFAMPASTIAVIHAVPNEQTGIATAALNTSRQIGSLIGVAIFGTIINNAENFISGMHYALIIGGVAYLGGSIATLLWLE